MEERITSLLEHITREITGQTRIRLGVTGLSRAGKTVFVTTLVANMLERDRLKLVSAAFDGRILSARLEEQPNPTLARFEYETHLAKLLNQNPQWPENTKNISEFRLSLRVAREGIGAVLHEEKIVHIDIVDYPGEWLLDLGLLDMRFAEWSEAILSKLRRDTRAQEFLALLASSPLDKPQSAPKIQALAQAFRALIQERRKAGIHDLVPGRFLLPAELEGAPAVTFTPLPFSENTSKSALYTLFEKRFRDYQSRVVRPFFKNHFLKLDRQVVLIDVLEALEQGPDALGTLQNAMIDILRAFRVGQNHFLSLGLNKKIDKIAFVATKADLLHQTEHENLTRLTKVLVRDALERAHFESAKTNTFALSSLRATTETEITQNGQTYPAVRGRRIEDNKTVSFVFGTLPEDPQAFILSRTMRPFFAPDLAPPDLTARKMPGLPHIRLDRLVEYLFGDKI